MNARRQTHGCVVVRSLLRQPKAALRGVLKHPEAARSMSPQEAREYLFDQLAQGREVLPISAGCGNPCARNGCAGFNYGEQGGCPGHIVDDAEVAGRGGV
jgi:hypothetical protein